MRCRTRSHDAAGDEITRLKRKLVTQDAEAGAGMEVSS